MSKTAVVHPFNGPFLKDFVLAPELLPLQDEEIKKLDSDLADYEQLFLNPDIERHLITRNELLASFAISKAEASGLTLSEAQAVYECILKNKAYKFVAEKLKKGLKLIRKDHDKLEFFNIAKTFRLLNSERFNLKDLKAEFVQDLHRQLTQGLDIFQSYLPEFEPYRSGKWRNNNLIRVGWYVPADFNAVERGVEELISYVKTDPSPTKIAVFHTALYALHPFSNGNKRVCRILEHLLLRSLGLNRKNLYSSSYYYHKEKTRYYKYLLYSLERKNLNHFVSFVDEALALSMVSVVQLSLQSKRNDFLVPQVEGIRTVLKPLVKRRQLQFKNLFRRVKRKMARQTFVNYLQQAADLNLVERRRKGRSTYYRLNLKAPEGKTLDVWLETLSGKLAYIPDEIRNG